MVSIKFPPVILGPEMAAPILWAPGIFGLFLMKNPHAHKIPPFRGGVLCFLGGGGGSSNFIFMGVGIFPLCCPFGLSPERVRHTIRTFPEKSRNPPVGKTPRLVNPPVYLLPIVSETWPPKRQLQTVRCVTRNCVKRGPRTTSLKSPRRAKHLRNSIASDALRRGMAPVRGRKSTPKIHRKW